jgi:hypothetical protein
MNTPSASPTATAHARPPSPAIILDDVASLMPMDAPGCFVPSSEVPRMDDGSRDGVDFCKLICETVEINDYLHLSKQLPQSLAGLNLRERDELAYGRRAAFHEDHVNDLVYVQIGAVDRDFMLCSLGDKDISMDLGYVVYETRNEHASRYLGLAATFTTYSKPWSRGVASFLDDNLQKMLQMVIHSKMKGNIFCDHGIFPFNTLPSALLFVRENNCRSDGLSAFKSPLQRRLELGLRASSSVLSTMLQVDKNMKMDQQDDKQVTCNELTPVEAALLSMDMTAAQFEKWIMEQDMRIPMLKKEWFMATPAPRKFLGSPYKPKLGSPPATLQQLRTSRHYAPVLADLSAQQLDFEAAIFGEKIGQQIFPAYPGIYFRI